VSGMLTTRRISRSHPRHTPLLSVTRLPPLGRGLFERLITDGLGAELEELGHGLDSERAPLPDAEAADRIALHVAAVLQKSIERYPEDRRARLGVLLARRIVDAIVADTPSAALASERPTVPASLLRAIRRIGPDGVPQRVDAPLIPLLDTALLTNAPGEPRVGHQIRTEIASADRIDVVMAFIRRSGIAPLRDALRLHVEGGRGLRVLTTTYTGSTEREALDLLEGLGADVRVSYDESSTRLHAKAWLFHRENGFSTAYVGSSNLTHWAQVSGLEWNVRVSAARNRPVIEKIAAVFESYWHQPEFESYDASRFASATRPTWEQGPLLVLSPVEIRLEPFQARMLEQIEVAREMGRHRNLLVSATGTGKTVMAAVDYARLRVRLPRARLLFVAHREEILEQSRRTFAQALRDASFGELWVGGHRPASFEHVFASIQSLDRSGLGHLAPDHYDVVIVDEFHHSAASSYERLLAHVAPRELLGLTATPERADGADVLHWFDGRIAAELRLWDAIDQHRLVPFAYYGIADDLDLREVPWRRGRGYDVERVTNLITSTDAWARQVLQQFVERVGRPDRVRALGFCVSVDHARYMARVFREHGVSAIAVWADTPSAERQGALNDLAAGRLNVLFSVDLFNEGVDVPSVDVLLMLRPTDSPVLFLQQLGRGLRRSDGKTLCTVLDFVGRHRKEFRYDRRFRALLGGTRRSLEHQIRQGFPFLPAGCHLELDRVAAERVLQNVRESVPRQWTAKVAEVRAAHLARPALSLADVLAETGLELEDVYDGKHSWSDLRDAAGLGVDVSGPAETMLRRACGRLLHVDDLERLDAWTALLSGGGPATLEDRPTRSFRLAAMLLTQLFAQQHGALPATDALRLLREHPQVTRELLDLLPVVRDRVTHVTSDLPGLADVPLRVHARYSRREILVACGIGRGVKTGSWQSGVYWVPSLPADLLAFTLDKTSGSFSPTTRYRDYAISEELIHWESQSVTAAGSETGRRYREHARRGSHVLLFARLTTDDRAFYFLGPATYVTHERERPMAVTWKLHHPLPGDLFQAFAAAVA